MTGDEIKEKVFKHYNYDGLQADADLNKLASAEAMRRRMRMSAPIWFGLTVFSAENCARLGVLSRSGKIGAIGGLAFGAMMTFTTIRA